MIFKVWQNWQKPYFQYKKPYYALLLPIIILLGLGLLIQFFLSPALSAAQQADVPTQYFFWRHLITVLVGLCALYAGFKIKLKNWLRFSGWIFIIGLLLSLLAVFIGGAADVRWLQIGAFSLQPVEILKVGFILLAAGYFHQALNQQCQTWRQVLVANKVPIILIAILGVIILVLQKDYGSMFVLGMIFLAMFWVSGLMARFLWLVFAFMAAIGLVFILIAPYRLERLIVFLNPTADCQDSGYQICQSLIGVGSGGLTGRGFNSTVQIYGYLPEVNNDTVFVGYAELTGFVGAVFMLSLLTYLVMILYRIAKRLEDNLMLIVIGCLTWIGTQSVVNLGGILNILPLKGITLPLVSSGGSSLVMLLLILGIVLQTSGYIIYKDERKNYQSGSRWRRHRRSRHATARSGA